MDCHSRPACVSEESLDRILLPIAELGEEAAARVQSCRRFRREATVEVESVCAAVEGHAWIEVAHLGLQRGDLGGGDVGRVRGDEVEAQFRREGGETIAEVKCDSPGQRISLRVASGQRESRIGNVQRVDAGGRTPRSEHDGDATSASAEVEHGGLRRSGFGQCGEGEFDERFGFRTWDEGCRADGDFQSEEGRAAGEMLQRFALRTALHERAEGGEFRIGQGAVVIQVELEAGELEHVGQQQLDLEARRVHAVALQELRAALDDFEDGHAGSVAERANGPKAFHPGKVLPLSRPGNLIESQAAFPILHAADNSRSSNRLMPETAQFEIRDDSTIALSPRQVSCGLGAESAILQMDSSKYFSLNPVGARVWQLLASPKQVNELLAALLAEYEVPADRCRADLLALLQKLQAAGLIEVRAA